MFQKVEAFEEKEEEEDDDDDDDDNDNNNKQWPKGRKNSRPNIMCGRMKAADTYTVDMCVKRARIF